MEIKLPAAAAVARFTRRWNLWNLQGERTKYAAPPLKPFCLVIVCSVEMNYTCDPINAPSVRRVRARAQQVSTHAEEGVIHGRRAGGRASEGNG